MRRISFALTTDAILARRKTVTRRLGWTRLKIGERLQAVDKLRTKSAQKLAVIEVVGVRRERLNAISDADVALEGNPFGARTAAEFVEGFCKEVHLTMPDMMVTRIEFRYVEVSDE